MDTWLIVLISIGAPLIYVTGFGFTWSLLKGLTHSDVELMLLGALFWPLCLAGLAGAALSGWMRRPKLPRATARERTSDS